MGCTQVFLARDGQMLGSMVLRDRVREHASSTVKKLQDRGYHTVMLTGTPQFIHLHCQCASSCDHKCRECGLACRLTSEFPVQGKLELALPDLPCTWTRRREGFAISWLAP